MLYAIVSADLTAGAYTIVDPVDSVVESGLSTNASRAVPAVSLTILRRDSESPIIEKPKTVLLAHIADCHEANAVTTISLPVVRVSVAPILQFDSTDRKVRGNSILSSQFDWDNGDPISRPLTPSR